MDQTMQISSNCIGLRSPLQQLFIPQISNPFSTRYTGIPVDQTWMGVAASTALSVVAKSKVFLLVCVCAGELRAMFRESPALENYLNIKQTMIKSSPRIDSRLAS